MSESKRINGNRRAEDIVKAYYSDLYKAKKEERKPEPEVIKPNTKKETKTEIFFSGNINDPENYILLPQTNEHPDLLIAKNRLSYGTEVEQAATELGLTLQNNSQNYIGNINWEHALKLNTELGNFTLNPKLFAEFLKLLKSGKAFDGTKNKVDSRELETILNEIIEVRNPWRAEWLDNKYSKQGGVLGIGSKLSVTYHKFDSSGKLIEVTEALDSDTLMENKTPGISLEDWINNPTSHGLPKSNVKNGNLYYWYPVDGRVARFGAGAGRAYLGCVGGPDDSDGVLGVRGAKIFKS